MSGDELLRHADFNAFKQGTLGNSGANLYVSKSGRLQIINTWDINQDGYNDVLLSNDHDIYETVDALIYWGSSHGFTSLLPPLWERRPLAQVVFGLMEPNKSVTRLPAFGGGKSLIKDLNNDGYPEIVFCNYIHNYPGVRTSFVYWGSKDGYLASRKTELPTHWASGVAAADLNGDGYPELIFANHGVEEGLSEISPDTGLESYIYWGSATGFSADRLTLVETHGARDVVIADINKDGYPDLAFINNSQLKDVQVFLGGPKGYSKEKSQTIKLVEPTSIRAGDINGDGYADLVITSSGRGESIASLEAGKQKENGNRRYTYILTGGADGLDARRQIRLPSYEASDSAMDDFNKDGFMDIAIANRSDGSTQSVSSFIYWGSPEGMSAQHRTELPSLGASSVVASDLNGDGYPDLLFANSSDGSTLDVSSYIYWGSKDGFATHSRTELQSFGASSANAGDLDRDGKTDIVLVNSGSGHSGGHLNSLVYWGNPQHQYSTALMTSLPTEGTYGTTVADLNDDGFPDLLFCNSYTNVSYLYPGSKNGFSPNRRQDLAVGSAYASHAADLNKDGYLDLVFSTMYEGKNVGIILWGSANGYTSEKCTLLPLKTRKSIANAIADLNRDNYLDLIFSEFYFGTNQIFWGGPDGYSEQRSWAKFMSAGSLKLADLNGDGYLDFIVAENFDPKRKSYNTKTKIFWGTPEGVPSFDNVVELETFGALECGIADLNRDGYLDLALSSYMSDSTRSLPLFIYWGDRGGRYSNERRTSLPAESSAGIQTVDLNRDGYPEIVVHNHLKDGNHSINSYIYWNSPEGFDKDRRTELPTFGPHFSQMIDPGNLYTRKLEEEFISRPESCSLENGSYELDWKGEEPHGAKLKFQVRGAASRENLPLAKWLGPKGEGSFYESSGTELKHLQKSDRLIQYRALFTSPDGGVWPVLREVIIRSR